MIHLIAIRKKKGSVPVESEKAFPFSVPVIRHLKRLEFPSPVTFFVGENGSGKSTLLEAIAAGTNAVTVGGQDIERDETLEHARTLSRVLEFEWSKRTQRGFFLRSEDFTNFARRMNIAVKELDDMAAEFAEQAKQNPESYGFRQASGTMRAQKAELTRRYGENLDANSHGEGFLKLFQARLVPGGLYLLDEPEAALSPTRQLSLLALMKSMVAQNCQFLVATHSPILMAYPDAVIFSFDQVPAAPVSYDDLEHVTLTRAFLNSPMSFIRHL